MFKSIIRPIVSCWEKLFSRIENIKVVENSPYGLLRMSVHPFKGQSIVLKDGTKIDSGDYIIELHISNLRLAKGEVGGIKVASDIQLLPLFRQELNNLAELASQGKLDPRAKALWGVTMLGPGLRRLGFQLEAMKEGLGSRLIVMWMNFLKWVFSPSSSKAPSRNKPKRKGYQYWMSIEELINKYQKR
ncbi:MAG: hypothetical protein GX375_03690 [Clostridiales bacterium]|nr:hypothetical protein [Clostridiales bacterium]